MNNTENLLDNQLQLDPIVKKYLSQSASWAKWRAETATCIRSLSKTTAAAVAIKNGPAMRRQA